ncbi:MAG: DUF4350 domain-containing protein, partial [Gammaproteobacteria bacterium]
MSWLTVTLPVFLGLYVVLHAHATIAVLIFWWLKPAYERLPLLIVSQALFGATPSVRTALREYLKLLPKQLFRTLTVRRFVPTRSLDQPVSQLENLAGAERHRRLELLRRTAGSPAFWLTLVGVHVEMFLTLGLLLLVFELIPGEFDLNLWESFVSQGSGQLEWLSNALYFCAVSLVGPIYAVSGFSLYINRRIELEGWDIELEFRRLMRRVGASLPRLAVALVFLIVCSPDELAAAEQATDATGSKALIEEIMEGPEFNEERVTRVPKALRDWFEEDDSETPASTNADWVVDLVRILAQSVEFALWVIVISFLIWIVYRHRGWLRQFLERSRSPGDDHERPSVMFGLNVEGRARTQPSVRRDGRPISPTDPSVAGHSLRPPHSNGRELQGHMRHMVDGPDDSSVSTPIEGAWARLAPRRGRTVAIASVAGLVIAGIGLWLYTTEWVEMRQNGGYTEEAVLNPFLAAGLFLERLGTEVESRVGLELLDDLPPVSHTLLVASSWRTLSERRVAALIEWVEQGGHLIMPGASTWSALRQSSGDPLLDYLEVQVLDQTGPSDERAPSDPSPPDSLMEGARANIVERPQ